MSERVKVVQIVTRFVAGAGGVALRGAAALDPDLFDVTVVTGSGGRLLDEARDAGMHTVLVPELVAPIRPAEDRRALRTLTTLLAEGRFDAVHTHSAKAGAVGRLAAHRAGVPRIVHTFHGFPFHQFQSPARRGAYVAVERRLGRFTDVFLAVGTGVAVEAIQRGIARPERIRVIGPAIAQDIVPVSLESRRAARAMLGLPMEAAVVGTVGRLDYQKAPEHLVRALAAMTRQDVVVVWIGGGELEAQTIAEARRLGVADRFLLVGERADVPALLPAFDVFAMSSRYEGLPCAVVEAQACGLPVVATAVNAVSDVVSPGETGLLVPPARPELLGAALGYLLAHPAEAARMAANGRAKLGNRFDPTTLGAILADAYAPVGRHAVVPRQALLAEG